MLTDHRPLVGIFRKQLHELDNARLMRMREKRTNFSFEVKWVEGKTHMIPDALSGAPEAGFLNVVLNIGTTWV